jgi:hypothetical protein
MRFLPMILSAALAAVFTTAGSAYGQGMAPNKDPVPSPSDLRAERGQDKPDGQAPEDRTPSPSDISTQRPRADGDLPSSGIQDPRNASAGGTGTQQSRDTVTGAGEPEKSPAEGYKTY